MTSEQERTIPKTGMKIETWIFLAIMVFFVVAAVIYTILAGAVEPVGVVALWLTAGMALIVGSFLWVSSRRLEHARPEDDDNADVADGAGELGFFSPGSYWPFALALSVAGTAVATAFWLDWLMIIMGTFLLMAICGLVFEYHRRPAHH